MAWALVSTLLASSAFAQEEGLVEAEPDATSQESSISPPAGVEVLRVRGRGLGAIETDIPSSVTEFDAATIQALGAQDVSDLARVTPNVNIVQPGSTQATFFVRGVGLSDFSSNAAGAVTIFQDDVAINAPAIQTGQLFDVEAVEVLRGPQGTGPFRNASAGAIRVRSRRPTGNHSAELRTSLGWYSTEGDKGARNAMIRDFEGAFETPIIDDTLAARFAFRLRDADPYKTNACGDALPFDLRKNRDPRVPPTEDVGVSQCGEESIRTIPVRGKSMIPFGLPEDVNDEHNWAARGTLSLQPPGTEMQFFLNFHGSRLDQDSTLGQAIGTRRLPGQSSDIRFAGRDDLNYADLDVREEFASLCQDLDPRPSAVRCANTSAHQQLAKRIAEDRPLDKRPYRGAYNRVGETTRDSWGGFVSAEGEVFADTRLFMLSSYDMYERFQENDSDFTPERVFETVQSDEAWQMYHELRLDGELSAQPIEWGLGGYYLKEQLDNHSMIFVGSGDGANTAVTQRIYDQTIDSLSIWGLFGWDFAEDFTLSGGVRFNWERKEFSFRKVGGIVNNLDLSTKEEATWGTPTGEIVLTYHIDENKTAYARYTRGFKAGHFNALASEFSTPAGLQIDIEPADEEYNDAWEAGLRGSWFDGRLQAAGAFFYYRYQNYQIFLFTDSANPGEPPVLEIVNAAEAENYGIEIEGTLRPLEGWAPRIIEGLRISGNFGWLHGEYLDFTTFRRFETGGGASGAPFGIFNIPIDYSGKRLQNAPEFKVSGTVDWTLDLGRFGYLIPRYDISWSDDVFFDPNEGRGSVDPTGGPSLIDFGVGQKAYFLHNVRLAYRSPTSNIEVAGWIRNVEDQVHKNYAFDASRFTGLVINFPGTPRTIGVDFSLTF